MRPRRTPTTHHPISLPGGTEDNDLWTRAERDGRGAPVMASIWEPSAAERAQLATGHNVELAVWGLIHPPVAVRVTAEQATGNRQRVDDGPRVWLELPEATVVDVLAALRIAYADRNALLDALSDAETGDERLAHLRVQLEANLAELARQRAQSAPPCGKCGKPMGYTSSHGYICSCAPIQGNGR